MVIKLTNKETGDEFQYKEEVNVEAFFFGSMLALKEKRWGPHKTLALIEFVWIIAMLNVFVFMLATGLAVAYAGSGVYVVAIVELMLLFVLRLYEAYDYNFLTVDWLTKIGYEPVTKNDRKKLEQLRENNIVF